MYPEQIDQFVDLLNKKQAGGVYVIEEELHMVNGVYEGFLEHDNVSYESISFFTGPKLTGSKIENFIISTPSETPWKRHIKVFSDADVVYATYETTGDQVEAEDINRLQDSMTATQEEVDRYKSENDQVVDEIDIRLTDVEDTKAEKTYVDTELNKKYDKDQVYTKEEVLQKIEDIIDAAPEALDTLGKIARALDEDPDFAATVTNSLAEKVDKVAGKGLSTEDFTTAEKGKLAGVEAGANKYTHPTTHPASIIVETSDKGFVSDVEKALWNAKETPSGAQSKADTAEQNAIEWAKSFGIGTVINNTVSDGNTLVESGLYRTEASTEGLPAEADSAGTILHIGRRSTATVTMGNQIYFPRNSIRIFVRTSNNILVTGGGWTSWKEFETTDGAQTKANTAETNAKSYADSIKPTKVSELSNDKNYVTQSELGNAGYGDMTKAVYDKNNNGKVDAAETADSVPWTGVTGKPSTFPPSGHPHTIGNITGLQAELDSKETPAGAQAKIDAIEIGSRNYFRRNLVSQIAFTSQGLVVTNNRNYVGYYMRVNEGEIYSISRKTLENNRFRVGFTEVEPAHNVPYFGEIDRDNFYKIESITVPAGANFLAVYLSNEGGSISEVMIEKGHKASDWTPAPEDMMPAGPITWNQLKGV
ncbi:hypothetical protein BEP19_15830 [Ammoniphilus oxalaticus]|uniref:Uncharacterized protein n=1 Tax=Ammoniphilus oxalaticus TaxID=66863 RepID=A0A419SQK8_9BACL|nr:pyocin knob domain-containing protein [Ammoniphilus oxalaticus]RKD26677.1 hypothetical protein BEP19_15830 [Ammoniphilus oxalaticus]